MSVAEGLAFEFGKRSKCCERFKPLKVEGPLFKLRGRSTSCISSRYRKSKGHFAQFVALRAQQGPAAGPIALH